MHHTFSTPHPTRLYVEFGAGRLDVDASEPTDRTEVRVEGARADEVVVEERDDEIVVVAPRRAGFLAGAFAGELRVQVSLPPSSDLMVKVGSADVTASGRYAETRLKSGSGDVEIDEITGTAVVETGSGDVTIGRAADHLRVKAGSGDIEVGCTAGSAVISSGSGTVQLGSVEAEAVLKTGSGDIRISDAHTDLSAMTGSGDVYVARVRRGALKAKAASGDISVAVPPGVPVWTDVSCLTGSVHSNLQGAGQPTEGQDHIEIRATTVSGDINLAQL